MNKNILVGLILVFILVVAGACSNNNNTLNDNNNLTGNENNEIDNKENNDNSSELDAYFKEADEFAEKVRVAFMSYDYDTIIELGTDVVLDSIDSYKEFKKGEVVFQDGLEYASEHYGLYRFDHLFDEEEGIVWYELQFMRYNEDNIRMVEWYYDEDFKTKEEREEMRLSHLGKSVKKTKHDVLKGELADTVVFPIRKNDEGIWELGGFKRMLAEFPISRPELDIAQGTKTIINEFPEYKRKKDDLF